MNETVLKILEKADNSFVRSLSSLLIFALLFFGGPWFAALLTASSLQMCTLALKTLEEKPRKFRFMLAAMLLLSAIVSFIVYL